MGSVSKWWLFLRAVMLACVPVFFYSSELLRFVTGTAFGSSMFVILRGCVFGVTGGAY